MIHRCFNISNMFICPLVLYIEGLYKGDMQCFFFFNTGLFLGLQLSFPVAFLYLFTGCEICWISRFYIWERYHCSSRSFVWMQSECTSSTFMLSLSCELKSKFLWFSESFRCTRFSGTFCLLFYEYCEFRHCYLLNAYSDIGLVSEANSRPPKKYEILKWHWGSNKSVLL